MIKAIETRGRRSDSTLSSPSRELCVGNYKPIQHLISCLERVSFALVRRRILSIISLCSMVWLASVWLAAVAQAQNLPAENSTLNTSEPTIQQRSVEKTKAPRLLLSMVDRSELEPARSLPSSSIQPIDPHSTDASGQTMKNLLTRNLYASLTEPSIDSIRSTGQKQNVEDVGLASNPRGAEFRSLAALTSTPSPSLLSPLQTRNGLHNSDQPDIKSSGNGNNALVYRFGTTSFVVNQLPNSFSVSSAGHSLPDAR